MLIDAHVHLFPYRLAEAVRAWFDQHAWSIRYRAKAEELIAELLAGGVDRAVALPYSHKPGMAEALNAFTLELARLHPMVVPCCTVFPGEPDEERILDEAFGRDGFAGMKLHSHVQRVSPDDPRCDAAWRASARYRKPIVFHCSPEPAIPGYGVDVKQFSGAARLRRALERHPGAIAIVPHLGIDEFAAFEALLRELPDVYLDTAMAISSYFEISGDPDLLRRHPTRILYGTDFPNLPYEWTRELAVIKALRLPPADEAAVLGGNAARLFGIAPAASPSTGGS